MGQEREPNETRPEAPPLKVVEREPDPKAPWSDDVLERREVADRLTKVITGLEAPLVISVDGRWGTGKTFLLKRWAQDIRNQDPKWQAIYYNAWEDDFADDPLLAIIAQFSEHGGPSLKQRVGKLVEVAGPLLSYGVSLAASLGTGVAVPPVPTGAPSPEERLNAYLEKRAAKNELKVLLRELAAEVRDETGQPLVFIIDELDRCRPTFAIELLERVKHIFDVPNLVFVFGINRSELTESLRSVYGEIDAGTYLRRFFEMEFVLPVPNPEKFCEHLFTRYGLDSLLARQIEDEGGDLREQTSLFPFVLDTLRLSLRDMDYCVRLLSLATRDLEPRASAPSPLLAALVALKIANQELYRAFVEGTARGADVINYFRTRRLLNGSGAPYRTGGNFSDTDRVEAALYAADSSGVVSNTIGAILSGWKVEEPQYLAEHHSQLDPKRDEERSQLVQLQQWVESYGSKSRMALEELARKIDVNYNLYYGSIGR